MHELLAATRCRYLDRSAVARVRAALGELRLGQAIDDPGHRRARHSLGAQHADDLDRAVAFYTGLLGGELIARFEPPGLAFLRLGQARLR